jgi:hypothetical protein
MPSEQPDVVAPPPAPPLAPQNILGGEDIQKRIIQFITESIPVSLNSQTVTKLKQNTRSIKSAYTDSDVTLHFPVNDSPTSWTKHPEGISGDMVSVSVTPNVKNPLISVQGPMLGGAAVKYTFKFVVDIRNPDALSTEKREQWNRLHRGEPPKLRTSLRLSEKKAKLGRTSSKGKEKAQEGGKRTRKNGKRSTLRKKRQST